MSEIVKDEMRRRIDHAINHCNRAEFLILGEQFDSECIKHLQDAQQMVEKVLHDVRYLRDKE